ncbi:MAG: hypothetical protein J6Y82_03410 [Bacteroidales bacterium]|nr:hypothetical protein [Bacteroidales bacterium]
MKTKSITFFLLAFASLLSITFIASCSNDDDEDDKPTKVDNYYVKYEVQTEKRVYICDKNITYKDVDEGKKIATRQDWSGTYGPFKKGDNVYLRVSINNTLNMMSGRISVSKNHEPFVVRAETIKSNSISLEYTIDF